MTLVVASYVLAATFVASGIQKLRSPEATAPMMLALGLRRHRHFFTPVWAAIELLLGFWLIVAPSPGSSLVALFTMTGLCLALVQMWRNGLESCSCFGHSQTPIEVGAGRNLLLIAALVIGLLLDTRHALFHTYRVDLLPALAAASAIVVTWSVVEPSLRRNAS